MSYPRKIHALVIEDEKDKRDDYREVFAELAKSGGLCGHPTFATCHEEACERIATEAIYHLVVLDLGLPYQRRHPAAEGAEPGQELLQRLATRERYPVPALLVVSGRLGLTRQTDLGDAVRRDFFYGRTVQKGPDDAAAIVAAVQAVERYCSVGVHLRDDGGGDKWFPALSPREEDLIRRCILERGHIGVDLTGWSAERGRSGVPEGCDNGPTKVFMGRFLLDGGHEHSRPTFFKFEPAAHAAYTFPSAAIMDEKLRHVKVCHRGSHRHRSLLVTQSVSDETPIPLDNYLLGSERDAQTLASIAQDIWAQLSALGTVEDEELRVRDAFWKPLTSDDGRAALVKACQVYGGAAAESTAPGPVELFDAVRSSTASVWTTFKSGTHGDLNASNIALGEDGRATRAWIFDAGCIERDVAVRDVAYLEATTLLFAAKPNSDDMRMASTVLYPPSDLADGKDAAAAPASVGNVVRFVREIRRVAATAVDPRLYAVLVFNAALSQLFGLAVAPSRNKIDDPAFAMQYARRVTAWVLSVAPEWAR
jgi:CheY-like chemotaxis protein